MIRRAASFGTVSFVAKKSHEHANPLYQSWRRLFGAMERHCESMDGWVKPASIEDADRWWPIALGIIPLGIRSRGRVDELHVSYMEKQMGRQLARQPADAADGGEEGAEGESPRPRRRRRRE